jgi:HK97 family phage prohead protease
MMTTRTERQLRAVATDFQTREENNAPHISGYFVVFNSVSEIFPGMTESVAPGAFQNTLSGDIRALVNHDSTLVLGRTKAHTLELKEDERGLWGDITINPEDRDAMNLYARVQRGDIDQASFGFAILNEDVEYREDCSTHWTIREVELYEVSACTFPAYEETNISARTAQRDHIRERQLDAWKTKMKGVLKNGTESPAAEKED